ncbi:MAG: manganese efflux pump MntP family protein [Clostridiales bacterium]|nr:manganese efflux pump MntP family protein [Clostridiales bacterium]
MTIVELLLLAIGLSMDAFAVSVCKGLAAPKLSFRHMAAVGAWFGGFQALMPMIGYFLGSAFAKYITSIDHWIAFVLLGIIGINMIKESISGDEETADASLGFKTMLIMAVATSIDALAVGITFAFLINTIGYLIFAVLLIGCTTFLLSAAGVKVGNIFGSKYKAKAEFIGGSILILLGIKILLEGLNIL